MSDVGAGILMATVGLLMTAAAIAGIVFFARRMKNADTAKTVWLILGIVALVPFILLGLFLGGCGAMIASVKIA